ncbi:hypothetical protein ACQR3P_18585 [Rhodococcus sp. IEGM1300]
MSWYKSGTVSVAQNSNAVIGTGTAFILNGRVGDAFVGPDGEMYEVANIASDTAFAISTPYKGPTIAAGPFALIPIQGYVKDTADALRQASNQIADSIDGLEDSVQEAADSAAAATASKNAAATSESNASQSAASALESKNAAGTSATNANNSASAALGSKNAAGTSATNASDSAAAALASKNAAAISEQNTANKAAKGANSDITSLSGLTTALSIAQGGTGAKTAAAALGALGAMADSDAAYTIIYPNGGIQASPANVALNSRYVTANPFPGKPVFCIAEILDGGNWVETGWFSYYIADNGGFQVNGVKASMLNDTIVVQTGLTALKNAGQYSGTPYGSVIINPAPCRVRVWRVKG